MQTLTQSNIVKSVRAALERSNYNEFRRVRIEETDDGRLHLDGTLPSYYLKQLANALCLVTPGVLRVDNEIKVV